MAERILKVGDTVLWRQTYGSTRSIAAKITAIEACSRPGIKYGVPVDAVPESLVPSCVFDLDNGHYAFGTQIDLIEQQMEEAA